MSNKVLHYLSKAWLDMLFPEFCSACGQSLMDHEKAICQTCLAEIPPTDFHLQPNNPFFREMKDRLTIDSASAGFYFRKGNKVQRILHEIKYKGDSKSMKLLGKYYGHQLIEESHILEVDGIIPVPIHPKKLNKRGFNQSELFAEGLAEVSGKKLITQDLKRIRNSESQIHKTREERLNSIKNDFHLMAKFPLRNKKILLVDDLMTTGATLEACGKLIYKESNTPISLLTMAYTLI